MSPRGRLHVINALILSRLSYIINVWGNTTNNILNKVQTGSECCGKTSYWLQEVYKSEDTAQELQLVKCKGTYELPLHHSDLENFKVEKTTIYVEQTPARS